jgi:hypothetical protein
VIINRNDKVKEDGMDRASSSRVREEECIQNFGGKTRWEDNKIMDLREI